MRPKDHEYNLLNQALDAIRTAVDVKAKILPFPKTKFPADALVQIDLNGRKEFFVADIKTTLSFGLRSMSFRRTISRKSLSIVRS